MSASFINEKVWLDKYKYEDAERTYHERLAKASLTPLADEVAKARQRLLEIRNKPASVEFSTTVDSNAVKFLERKFVEYHKSLCKIESDVSSLDARLTTIESRLASDKKFTTKPVTLDNVKVSKDEDDIDFFGSDSDEDDEAAMKVREERLAAYNAKKSKKPVIVAKSSIVLDVKPWDDETDMKVMEEAVKKIKIEGLLWGAAKLVPLAYGINKLQISCVVEDEKVSVDWLQEQIEEIEDYVQSVDIAAFNKI